MSEIKQIVDQLMKAKEAYYNDEPIMTDQQFDDLEENLRKKDPNNSYFHVVGIPISAKANKIKHVHPMLSCGKAQTIDDVQSWLQKILNKRVELIIEPKIDGMSATIKYVNGNLEYIATRGDGEVGEDITYIKDYVKIPQKIRSCETVEVRGELYLPKGHSLPNPENKPLRNIAVGLVKRKDNREDMKHVRFIAYQVVSDVNRYPQEIQKLFQLSDWGFSVVDHEKVMSVKSINEYYEHYKKDLRNMWAYETDGLVIIVNDINLHQEINDKYVVSHHNHYNIAFKPPAESKITQVVDVEWNVSRLGNVVPTAILKPVEIGGSKIQRVTMNNYNNIKKMNLCLGDDVDVAKANDVIPYFKGIVKRNNGSVFEINECPSCGQKLVINGEHKRCVNSDCPEINIQKIVYWIKVNEIDFVSEKTVRKFFDQGIIKNIKDLYNLDYDKVKNLEGMGDKKISNLKYQLEKSKSMNIAQFITSLGILQVGEKAVKKLGIETLVDFMHFNDKEYVIGQNIIEFRNNNLEYIEELLDIVKITDPVSKPVAQNGKVCMTGTGHKGRKELVADLEKMGYEFVDSVSKDTAFLITDDPNSKSSKTTKAVKLNIPIKTYQEFFI